LRLVITPWIWTLRPAYGETGDVPLTRKLAACCRLAMVVKAGDFTNARGTQALELGVCAMTSDGCTKYASKVPNSGSV
jgi:hypothetical protein